MREDQCFQPFPSSSHRWRLQPVIRATQHRADRHHDDLAQTIAFGWSLRGSSRREKMDSRVIVTLAKGEGRTTFLQMLQISYCISLIVNDFGVGLRHLRKRLPVHSSALPTRRRTDRSRLRLADSGPVIGIAPVFLTLLRRPCRRAAEKRRQRAVAASSLLFIPAEPA